MKIANFKVFIGLVLLTSCGVKKADTSSQPTVKVANEDMRMETIIARIEEGSLTSDPVTIKSVSIKGNFMEMEISYNAGCANHTFEFTGDSKIAKSLPPIRNVQLIHASNGDQCEKVFNRKILIDVSELAYKKEKGSEIYLKLSGWKENIKYTFE